MPRGVFIEKIDVLTLLVENGINNEEQLMKSVISYLISHQYRRSEAAQTVCLHCLQHLHVSDVKIVF